ncbi:PAS domain S-box protein [Leptospira vanthielii]|uniref:PAS domain S-box protein n=1 Tax=Leptospira vanthielii TaxID=293085 RepID=UPI003145660E
MALRLFESNQKQTEAQELFEKAFMVSPIAMSLHDTSNQFQFVNVNPAFEKLIGYEKKEIIGKTSLDLNMYVNNADSAEIRKRFLADGKPHALTFQNFVF